jgi:hypothetical protein
MLKPAFSNSLFNLKTDSMLGAKIQRCNLRQTPLCFFIHAISVPKINFVFDLLFFNL